MAKLGNRSIGVGPALRRAREIHGLSLEQASRDTKLHPDQIRALESEEFDALLGDVYVRGALRTYAQYLGLDPEKVTGAYARHADEPAPTPPPARLGPVERAIAASRVRDNQRFLIAGATLVIVLFVVFGFLSRGQGSPAPAALTTQTQAPVSEDPELEVVLEARRDVPVSVVADGVSRRFEMERGETRVLTARTTLQIDVPDGGAIEVTENGMEIGAPGASGRPWEGWYATDLDATPSPAP